MPLAAIHWKAVYRLQSRQSWAKNNDWPASSKLCLLPDGCLKILQGAEGCAHLCLERDWKGFLISYYSFLQLEWRLQDIYVWKQAMILYCLQWGQLLQGLGTQHPSKLLCSAVNFTLQGKTSMESSGNFGFPKGLPSPVPCLPSLLSVSCHRAPPLHLPQCNDIQLFVSLSTNWAQQTLAVNRSILWFLPYMSLCKEQRQWYYVLLWWGELLFP